LPPSIVLEAMKILADEIELREDTRVAEQAKPALDDEAFEERSAALADRQNRLVNRCDELTDRIRNLAHADEYFGKEIALLSEVADVMSDAEQILSRPETGAEAMAAETEVIELLLQSKRINPNGGGGGGSSPGGGGGGTTSDAALALVGKGVNQREVRTRREVAQITGETTTKHPAEFRSGLDEYFSRILEAKP
jgi:hypothetical protein